MLLSCCSSVHCLVPQHLHETAHTRQAAAGIVAIPAACPPSRVGTASTTHHNRRMACRVVQRQPELCVIVDERNQVIGSATRQETVGNRLLGRGAYVLVFNSAGQLFVSQRSLSKDCYPGCMDVTISGVVNWGEEYRDTAVRELQEELGIPPDTSSAALQQLWVFPYQDNVCHVFGCAFRVEWDGPVHFADAEVEWGRFMSMEDLQQQLQQDAGRFTPVGRHILQLYLARDQQQQEQQQDEQTR